MGTMFHYLDIQGRIDFQMKDLISLRLNLQKVGHCVDQLPCSRCMLEMIILISRGVSSSEGEEILILKGDYLHRYAVEMVQKGKSP